MVRLPCSLVLLLLVSILHQSHSEHFLAIFQSGSRSLYRAYEPLMRELAARGHHLTVVGSFPQRKPVDNLVDIYVPIRQSTADSAPRYEQCRTLLSHPRVSALLDPVHHFDLIFLEFDLHQCLLGLAAFHSNASLVGLFGPSGTHTDHDLLGNTSPYSYVPHSLQPFSDQMTLLERTRNAVAILRERWQAHRQDAGFEGILREFFPGERTMPSVREMQKSIRMVFFYSDVSLDFARPLLPNMFDVGGMHIRPPRKLSKDILSVLDSSSKDVVVVSLGQETKDLVGVVKREVATALSILYEVVLWKGGEHMQDYAPNVVVRKTLPLADVLAHPSVRLFITQGDFLQVQLAVYHGVPLLVIPFTSDQAYQALRAQQLGFGLRLDSSDVTSASVYSAVYKMLNNDSYRAQARLVSERFRDQPTAPLARAVYWTEYLLHTEGAQHLQSVSRDLAWYQYFLVDVMVVLLVGISLALFLLYKVLRKVFGRAGGAATLDAQEMERKKTS